MCQSSIQVVAITIQCLMVWIVMGQHSILVRGPSVSRINTTHEKVCKRAGYLTTTAAFVCPAVYMCAMLELLDDPHAGASNSSGSHRFQQ